MQIPPQYIGHWSGEITDYNRKKPYKGEIVLSGDEVDTTYFMAQGIQRGKPNLHYESDSFAIFQETVMSDTNPNSWSGTLLVYMDSDDTLKCVWRSGAGLSSEASMTRV